MLNDLVTLNVFAFMLVLARIGTMIAVTPGISAVYVSIRIRILLAMAISFAMTPALAGNLPLQPRSFVALVLLIAGEMLIGAFFGLIAQILIGALQTAGTLLALFSSLANALIRDPVAQQQSSVFANFLSTAGLVLIFVTDLHHLWFMAIAQSYEIFVPGGPLPIGDFANMLAVKVSESFALGLKLVVPFLLIAMVYYVGLGILGRLMPVLPVFFFGLPIQIGVQITALALVFSSMMLVFLRHFQEAFTAFLAS